MSEEGLVGKVAIVTGASRGLGRAASLALSAQGVRVVGIARSADQLHSLETESDGMVTPLVGDLTEPRSLPGLVETTIAQLGGVDILVNNAGIAPAAWHIEQDLEQWQMTIDVNLTAPAVLAKASADHMRTRGGGKIINIASTSGIRGKPGLAGYSASKGGLLRLTEALAGEWARFGIQVNAIAPGAFETEAQRAVLDSEETLAKRLRKIPARRMGDPAEIGPLVCYLASPASDFVTGSVFVIDGGEAGRL